MQGESKDLLFVLTEKLKFCILEWDAAKGGWLPGYLCLCLHLCAYWSGMPPRVGGCLGTPLIFCLGPRLCADGMSLASPAILPSTPPVIPWVIPSPSPRHSLPSPVNPPLAPWKL